MHNSEIKKVYEDSLLKLVPFLSPDDPQLYYLLLVLHDQKKEIMILDAGCGNGNYAAYIASLGYKHVEAVDLFDSLKNRGFHYRQASIDSLPFENDFFNLIYSNSVIYYLKEPYKGIEEFRRVLKEDGLLLMTAHTKYSLFTLWRIFKRDILKRKSMKHLLGVSFYSAKYYQELLKKNGFEILLQDGYRFSFFFYPLYQKLSRAFERYFHIHLPLLKPYSNMGILGRIKSEFSYHSVFIARKKSD
jgi:SAM-dependent methyltransferase